MLDTRYVVYCVHEKENIHIIRYITLLYWKIRNCSSTVPGRNDSHNTSAQNVYNATQFCSEKHVYVPTNPTVAAPRITKIKCASFRAPPARFRLTMPIRANRPNTRGHPQCRLPTYCAFSLRYSQSLRKRAQTQRKKQESINSYWPI